MEQKLFDRLGINSVDYLTSLILSYLCRELILADPNAVHPLMDKSVPGRPQRKTMQTTLHSYNF
jgi:hypothetical protein